MWLWHLREEREQERGLSKSFRLKCNSEKLSASPRESPRAKMVCDRSTVMGRTNRPYSLGLPSHWPELPIRGSKTEASSKGTVSRREGSLPFTWQMGDHRTHIQG